MDAKVAITSQYLAVLEMLKQVVANCPDEVWRDAEARVEIGWVGKYPKE